MLEYWDWGMLEFRNDGSQAPHAVRYPSIPEVVTWISTQMVDSH